MRRMLSRVWGITALFVGVASLSCSCQAQTTRSNPIENLRQDNTFKFYSSLFPVSGERFEAERDEVMPPQSLIYAAKYLEYQLELHKGNYIIEFDSLLQALQVMLGSQVRLQPLRSVLLSVHDDQVAWSNAISANEIALGARVLRGLMLGGLREAASGTPLENNYLASLLQVSPATSTRDLELKARRIFAAVQNGKASPRTPDDRGLNPRFDFFSFDEDKTAARGAAFQSRLEIAAAGGDLSASDGQGIKYTFSAIDNQFGPALRFLLAHEIGHIALGHLPFTDYTSCGDQQRREDDADTFAIALLSYSTTGTEQIAESVLAKFDKVAAPRSSSEWLYGYGHAIRYGIGMAGSSNMLMENCPYRTPIDRLLFLEGAYSRISARRAKAMEEAFAYLRRHPPYFYANEDVLAWTEREALERKVQARCRRVAKKGLPVSKLRTSEDAAYPFVSCGNLPDPNWSKHAISAQIGAHLVQSMLHGYRTGMPSAGDELFAKLLRFPIDLNKLRSSPR